MKAREAEIRTKREKEGPALGEGSRRTLECWVLAQRLPVAIPNPNSYIPTPSGGLC